MTVRAHYIDTLTAAIIIDLGNFPSNNPVNQLRIASAIGCDSVHKFILIQ